MAKVSYSRSRRFNRRRCNFCSDDVSYIDYKDLRTLKRYVSERGKIRPKRSTGTCAKHQRMLARAVKRARFMGLLPYVVDFYR
jgi:small subunit ribosomal protein S18